MRTTILLLSVDEAPMLAYSLPAAIQQAADVVVVDNASADATETVARDHGARYLRLDSRRTYAAAVNEALAQTTDPDAILLLNADCFLEPGFLKASLPHLKDPGIGSVAPKLLRTTGPGEHQRLDQVDTAGMVVDRHRKNGLVGHARPSRTYSQRAEAFGADGAAALYRRQTLMECALDGGEVLDEDLELWASDADLAWRARLLGWRCVYEPAAVAYHVRTYSPSTRARMSEEARRMQFRNRYLMMLKNETSRSFIRHAPLIVGYEMLALGHVMLRERHLLSGYRDAWRLRGRARRRRALVQARRRVEVPPFGLAPPA